MVTRLLVGDCRDLLPTLPAQSVHCVVTSPPYFGLRDYGTADWQGGDVACDHIEARANLNNGFNERWGNSPGERKQEQGRSEQYRDNCGKCGAVRIDHQIGLEASLDEYITTLVAVFREVWRVLRDDGTCWLNLGDSYNGGKVGNTNGGESSGLRRDGRSEASRQKSNGLQFDQMQAMEFRKPEQDGLKPKDLMMVPARVALALQADGWWIRSDIIWAKKAPMPESVTDRPTSAHEHVFLLTKRARYFYDCDAVREPNETNLPVVIKDRSRDRHSYDGPIVEREKDGWSSLGYHPSGRNLRNVWHLGPAPFPEAHFATFPPALVEPCIKAGTSERGCCAACGAPWVRVVERSVAYGSGSGKAGNVPNGKYAGTAQAESGEYDIRMGPQLSTQTVGWQPSCACAADVIPCTVLDPFAGSGTVGLVADRLGRDSVLIELNPAYAAMSCDRITNDAPLFTTVLM